MCGNVIVAPCLKTFEPMISVILHNLILPFVQPFLRLFCYESQPHIKESNLTLLTDNHCVKLLNSHAQRE